MGYVLFACTHNAGRSQIAQASFERHAPADVRAESAGSDPARYDDAPIRSHVLALAHRQTRERLRHDHCDAPAATT